MQTKNFNGMFGKVKNGLCRLSMNGIAIQTSDGYKSYDINTGTLVNCQDFVFDVGDDMFFIIPTNNLLKGDVILINGKPACVLKVDTNRIEVFKYEDSSITTIVPERFVFFGNTYFYSKVVSFFGNITGSNSQMDMNQMLPFMMMSEMFKGDNKLSGNGDGMGGMMKTMMMMNMMGTMNGNKGTGANPFAGMFSMMAPTPTPTPVNPSVVTPISDYVTSSESSTENGTIYTNNGFVTPTVE